MTITYSSSEISENIHFNTSCSSESSSSQIEDDDKIINQDSDISECNMVPNNSLCSSQLSSNQSLNGRIRESQEINSMLKPNPYLDQSSSSQIDDDKIINQHSDTLECNIVPSNSPYFSQFSLNQSHNERIYENPELNSMLKSNLHSYSSYQAQQTSIKREFRIINQRPKRSIQSNHLNNYQRQNYTSNLSKKSHSISCNNILTFMLFLSSLFIFAIGTSYKDKEEDKNISNYFTTISVFNFFAAAVLFFNNNNTPCKKLLNKIITNNSPMEQTIWEV
ncbi:MAG: hypothetical protein HRK26_02630 [Rickettsiaceae bacterium H1]|nr:hypothetical protein [Rickettsiaceae bacterium H1]